MKKKIGIYDSGIGGFSILIELAKLLPEVDFYYISDRPFSPYGEKESAFICERGRVITQELLIHKVDLIVIACNSATAESIDYLRSNFEIRFVGVEPFVKAINAIDLEDPKNKVLLLLTKATAASSRFKSLMKKNDPLAKVTAYPCLTLASLIEEAHINGLGQEGLDKIHRELSVLKGRGFTHIILGCTHYPLISKLISSYLNAQCISPCLQVAKRVRSLIEDSEERVGQIYFKQSNESRFRILRPSELTISIKR